MNRPPPAGRFFWNELHTPDPAKALELYENVPGMTRQAMEAPGFTYYVLAKDGVGRAGVSGEATEGAAHWLPYVSVDDADATLPRARKLGAESCAGPADIPGVGRFGVLTDPTGASIAVMKVIPRSG